jgi:hypothetical protein
MDAGGDVAVVWAGNDDQSGVQGIYARWYDAAAGTLGNSFRVNSPLLPGGGPTAAMDDVGDLLVAWTTGASLQSPTDIHARRYVKDHPSVVGRSVFYNGSAFDAAGGDDAAIATDKSALLPGQSATFANVTSYSRGINGVMVDVANLPAGVTLTADDFSFRTGRGPDPATFVAGPSAVQVSVRRGAGANGSDRVTLTWPDYDPTSATPLAQAVANGWLEVTVKANANTDMMTPDVFRVGNLIGDSGDSDTSFRVSALDLGAAKRLLNTTAAITDNADFNRDGRINALDLGIVKRNLNQTLAPLALPISAALESADPGPGPFAAGGTTSARRITEELLA